MKEHLKKKLLQMGFVLLEQQGLTQPNIHLLLGLLLWPVRKENGPCSSMLVLVGVYKGELWSLKCKHFKNKQLRYF